MCVAVPGRVVAKEVGSTTATVLFGAAERQVDLTMTPEVSVGDWVIAHSGFALRRITETAASEIHELLSRSPQPHS